MGSPWEVSHSLRPSLRTLGTLHRRLRGVGSWGHFFPFYSIILGVNSMHEYILYTIFCLYVFYIWNMDVTCHVRIWQICYMIMKACQPHTVNLTGASSCQEPPFEDRGIWKMCQEYAEQPTSINQETSNCWTLEIAAFTHPFQSQDPTSIHLLKQNGVMSSDRRSSSKKSIDSASLMFRFALSSACFMLFVQRLVREYWGNCRRSCPSLPNQSQLYLF